MQICGLAKRASHFHRKDYLKNLYNIIGKLKLKFNVDICESRREVYLQYGLLENKIFISSLF